MTITINQTKQDLVNEQLDQLEVSDSITKKELCMRVYGAHDYFIEQEFDKLFKYYRHKNYMKKFVTNLGEISRIN
jgi:hypothetical protein